MLRLSANVALGGPSQDSGSTNLHGACGPSWVFRIFDHACPKHWLACCGATTRLQLWLFPAVRVPRASNRVRRGLGGGGGCGQSGTQEWDRAWVAQGRGPCRDRGDSAGGLAVIVLRAQDSLAARMLAAAALKLRRDESAQAEAWA